MLIYFGIVVVFVIIFITSVVQKKQINKSEEDTIKNEETDLRDEIEEALLKDAVNKRKDNFVQNNSDDKKNSNIHTTPDSIESDNDDIPSMSNKFVLHRPVKKLEVKTFRFDT